MFFVSSTYKSYVYTILLSKCAVALCLKNENNKNQNQCAYLNNTVLLKNTNLHLSLQQVIIVLLVVVLELILMVAD